MIEIILAAAIVIDTPQRAVTHRVKVGDASYRVRVKGDEVLVARKALFMTYDIAERDRQRQAVVISTGCRIIDELPSDDGRLRGKLDC